MWRIPDTHFSLLEHEIPGLIPCREEFGTAETIGGMTINGSSHIITQAPYKSIMSAFRHKHHRREQSTTDTVKTSAEHVHHSEEEAQQRQVHAAIAQFIFSLGNYSGEDRFPISKCLWPSVFFCNFFWYHCVHAGLRKVLEEWDED